MPHSRLSADKAGGLPKPAPKSSFVNESGPAAKEDQKHGLTAVFDRSFIATLEAAHVQHTRANSAKELIPMILGR
jgi:hypothetical protein